MASLEMAKARFAEAGFTRSDRYQEGTRGKGAKWQGSKERAKANFAPAMQEALQKGSYAKGLDSANAADYDSGVQNKGVNNWPVGMQASAEKFGKNVQAFVRLWDEALPTAAGNRRSAANLKRMTENVQRFITASGK
jgi:hypothetical protein